MEVKPASPIQCIKAVIFDVDGTLLDTETLATRAIEMVLESIGSKVTVTWDLKQRILGLRGTEWSKIVIDEFQLSDKITPIELITEWERNLSNLSNEVELMAGARDLINRCYELDIPMAVATSSNFESYSKKKSRYTDVFSKISIEVCGDNPQVKVGKPAPDIYQVAARELGISPNECLAFEDALSGVIAAKRAGMYCIACPDSRMDKELFLDETPYVVHSLRDVNILDWYKR